MKKRMSFRGRVSVTILVFFAAVFAVPALREGDARLWALTAAVPGGMLIMLLVPFSLDRPSLAAVMSLCGFGIMAFVFRSPDAAICQALRCAAAMFFLLLGAVLIRSFRASLPASALSAAFGLGLLSCPFWMNSGLSFAEGGIALLLFSVAAFLSLRMYLPALGTALCGLLFLLLQQDLPLASVWVLSCVLVFWAASGSGVWSMLSLVCFTALYGGYLVMFPPVAAEPSASLLPRLVSMPLFAPEVPADTVVPTSDFIFLLLGEDYGVFFLLFVILLLCFLLVRGASLALGARKSFHASLSLGVVLFFGLRTLFFLLSVSDVLPFRPGELPFLTNSLPNLFAECFLAGLLSGVSARNETDLEEDARLSMLAH